MGEYEDFVYLFKCEKETGTSSVGQLYTYYGVTSDGEVKEFESYDESRVGTVCYYFLRNDKPYDFAPAPYETDLVSVELLGNKDTVEYRYEGKNTESNIYSNLDKVYDLTDTSDLKAGDKVDTYDWKWQTTKAVSYTHLDVYKRQGYHVVWLMRCTQDIENGYLKLKKQRGDKCLWKWRKPTTNFGRWTSDNRCVTILLQYKSAPDGTLEN